MTLDFQSVASTLNLEQDGFFALRWMTVNVGLSVDMIF